MQRYSIEAREAGGPFRSLGDFCGRIDLRLANKRVLESLAKVGEASLKRFEWSEGGDKIYLRYDRALEPSVLTNALKAIGVNTNQVQSFGRADHNTYEVTLVGLDSEIRRGLDAGLGAGAVAAIPKVDSVGQTAARKLFAAGSRKPSPTTEPGVRISVTPRSTIPLACEGSSSWSQIATLCPRRRSLPT